MAARTTKNPRLKALFSRLDSAGLPEKYIRKMAFPSWWKDDLAADDGGYGRALGFIHHHVGISLETLWQDNKAIACPVHGQVNFKKSQNLTATDVQWARCIGVAASDIAIEAMPPKKVKGPNTGTAVHNAIKEDGNQCVNLNNLLEYIWSLGIPVLHIDEYPGKKMAGLAVRMRNRPAIVLCTNHKQPAKMMFDLAHELGHILLNHVGVEGVLVDAEISPSEEIDIQEREANEFSVAALIGDSNRVYRSGVNYTGEKLAEWCIAKGERDGVLPAVIAQQYGHHKNHQGAAAKACNILGGDDAVITVRRKMVEEINLDNLSDEDAEFLITVAGKGAVDAVPAGH